MKRGGELKRTTRLKRKRSTPRRHPRARCSYTNQCRKEPRVILGPDERMCRTHATWTADKLVGDWVKARDGRCILAGFNGQPCYEPETLYWCHLVPKGTYPKGRYLPGNAVAGCSRHHRSFDLLLIEKREWIAAYLGEEGLDLLETMVRSDQPGVADVIREYRALEAA